MFAVANGFQVFSPNQQQQQNVGSSPDETGGRGYTGSRTLTVTPSLQNRQGSINLVDMFQLEPLGNAEVVAIPDYALTGAVDFLILTSSVSTRLLRASASRRSRELSDRMKNEQDSSTPTTGRK